MNMGNETKNNAAAVAVDPKRLFSDMKRQYENAADNFTRRITVCAGTGCVAGGSLKVFAELKNRIEEANLHVVAELTYDDCLCGHDASQHLETAIEEETTGEAIRLSKSGCQGFCQMGPLVTIEPDGILYKTVRVDDVDEIVRETLLGGTVVTRLLYVDQATKKQCLGQKEIPFYTAQTRSVLKPCGVIDPEDIYEYVAQEGYEAARRAWCEMQPGDVCEEVEHSGLRGRGGGGFPTGRKWRFTLVERNEKKYVICNADEGDPGAFMDRSVMEGNPHAVIEGMMIAARAIGADEGYVYVRLEYPLAVNRIRKAVADAERMGILGDDVFGTGRGFRLHVMEGAGAFVCGEETALIASIEGCRGMPRPKPPFPAQSGLWGCPTVINNVETLASVPAIILKGAKEFRSLGTEGSPGTKTFALTGHVANTGLIEVPFGTTLRRIIFDIGGGVIDDNGRPWPDGFKAVQIGGPSGGCLTEEHLDLPLDFDSLRTVGAMVGSGGLVVMNRSTCMVKMARFFMQFTQNESGGKCLLCREGTRQMLALLDDIIEARANENTLKLLEQLAPAVGKGSLCGLGKTAPNPVLSALRNFRAEVEAHITQQRCPAGQCKALLMPEIIAEKCKGCTACMRKCPVNAISGQPKTPHTINADLCIKCGECARTCRFDAIVGVG